MNEHQKKELVDSPNLVELIDSLQRINQFAKNPHALVQPSENDFSNLEESIKGLRYIDEATRIEFKAVVGGFISRAQAKPLRKDFKDWSANIFRAGVIKKMYPLYINASLVSQLLERINGEDFIEISLGKKDDKLCVMMAAVTKEGRRVDDPDKTRAAADLLDDMRPCPQPPCPEALD